MLQTSTSSIANKMSRPSLPMITNAISVDVEEFFHAHNLTSVAPRNLWGSYESRVEKPTKLILDLFDKHNITGTFFALGYVARRHRLLIREIADRGHEIASHGYAHQLAYHQTPRQFERDVRIAKVLLEDIVGQSVCGYRAPSFSIVSRNSWAYECLLNCGYSYDSSHYPIRHPRYGSNSKNFSTFQVQTASGELTVAPLAVSTFQVVNAIFRMPVAGGAYWRFLPTHFVRYALRRINHTEGRAFIAYFHPWELDPDQPIFHALEPLTKLRHYGGLGSFSKTVESIIKSYNFSTVSNLILQGKRENRQPE